MGRTARRVIARGIARGLTVLAMALPLVAAPAPVAGAAPLQNLRALYHLEGVSTGLPLLLPDTTPDSSGLGNTATVVGATRTTGHFSPSYGTWGALRFNPFDTNGGDYLDIADDPTLDIAGDITVETWFNAAGFTAAPGEPDRNLMLVSKSQSALNQSWALGITAEPVGSPNNICGNIPVRPVAYFYAITASGPAITCGTTPVAANSFHHVAGRYTPATGTAQLYLDGVPAASTVTAAAPGSAISASTANVQIGARPYAGFRGYFTGLIDETRIWSRALDANEIAMSADLGLQTEGAGGSGGVDAGPTPTPGASVPTVVSQDGAGDVFASETARIDGVVTRTNWYVLTSDPAVALSDPDHDGDVVEHLTITTSFNATVTFSLIDTNDDGVIGAGERRGLQITLARQNPTAEMRVGFTATLTNGQQVSGFVLSR